MMIILEVNYFQPLIFIKYTQNRNLPSNNHSNALFKDKILTFYLKIVLLQF